MVKALLYIGRINRWSSVLGGVPYNIFNAKVSSSLNPDWSYVCSSIIGAHKWILYLIQLS